MELRCDRAFFPKVKTTEEGYLQGTAIVAKFNNVQAYWNADGTKRLEFRPESEVLSEKSLNSIKNKPITIDHPQKLVNVDNVSSYIVGYTGESIHIDGNNVAVSLTITNPEAIKAIKRGKRQLSLGYELELVKKSGNFDGQEYTHVQTNLNCNHLSIVDMARAGSIARINTDSAENHDSEFNFILEEEIMTHSDSEVESTIDSKVEASSSTENVIETLTEDIKNNVVESLTDDVKNNAGESKELNKDSLEAAIANLEGIVKKLKFTNFDSDVNINELVAQRSKLIDQAKKVVNTDSLHEKSNREIMEHAIKFKDKTIALDGKSDDYVAARFEALIENVKSDPIKKQLSNLTLNTDNTKPLSITELMNKKYYSNLNKK